MAKLIENTIKTQIQQAVTVGTEPSPTPPAKEPALDFLMMVFQSNPQKDFLYYWINGEKIRKMMRRDEFYKLVNAKSPQLIGTAHQAAITYSFYLWSIPDQTITHLTPTPGEETQYPNSISNIIHKRKPAIVVEKRSIEDVLMSYGFAAPSAQNIQNLRVSMEQKDPQKEGFLSRFLNRYGTK